MRERVKNKSVMRKYLWLVMLTGVLAVAGIPAQGMGTLTAETADTLINSTNFPDEIFRAYVSENFDTDGNGVLSDAEKDAVTSIDVAYESIFSMVGIENFKNLEILDCYGTQISSLDVSKNTALTNLNCSDTQISSLDVSKNTALTNLDCYRTQISSLDVSKNIVLTKLYCHETQISSLDVSKNTALTRLDCSYNKISSLDVNKNTALEHLDCSGTKICNLDVSKNIALTDLNCALSRISSLDVSKNIALTDLCCSMIKISSLDVSKNKELKNLWCFSTQISSLDVSNNTVLENLQCGYTKISSLDVSNNTVLECLDCAGNRFSNGMSSFDTKGLNGFDLSRASGWTNASISGTVVTAVDTSSPVTYIYDCGNNYSATFTFLPTPVVYTVTFNANGGSNGTTKTSKSVTYGSSYGTLPTPIRTGYTFAGWYTSAGGGSQVTSSTTVRITGNQTLYAHWTQNSNPNYTVTFNANGGSCGATSKSVTYGNSYGTLPTPTRTGYTFAGWYISLSGGNQVTTNTIVSISSDHTLYAHWTLKPSSGGNNTNPEETEKKDDKVNPLASVKPKLKVKIAGANKVKLSWNKVKGAQKYHVYRATSKNGDYKLVKILPKSKLKYTMGKLQSNHKYYFKLICSTVSAGQTMYSQETIVSKKVYGRPKNPQVTKAKEGSYVRLRWKRQKNIAKVIVMKNKNQSGWEIMASLSGKSTSYKLDPKLFVRGSKYQFRIQMYYFKDGVKIYSKYSNPVKLSL